ncbi:DinB family protein [Pontivivens ytuae]|uniref:DinB family protein n=1 Tax=Pontivivens ytuae TaxID=2789856 RepID=UPI0030CD7004
MISPDWVRMMARYNAWQNGLVYDCAERVGAAARQAERGAFFGSIEKTLNHLLWADRMWMSRFAGTPKPKTGSIAASVGEEADWATLAAERVAMDRVISDWAAGWRRAR